MKTTIKKTTKAVTSISWEGTITDDEGKAIARMTGTINGASPLGNTNLMVLSSAKYTENADDVKSAYTDFQTMVQNAVSEIGELSTSTTEIVE